MTDAEAQRLACAVLRQAALDAARGDRTGQAARGWLTRPSADLAFWCAVAGLDVGAMQWCASRVETQTAPEHSDAA